LSVASGVSKKSRCQKAWKVQVEEKGKGKKKMKRVKKQRVAKKKGTCPTKKVGAGKSLSWGKGRDQVWKKIWVFVNRDGKVYRAPLK